jgi:phage tail sheath protein FI
MPAALTYPGVYIEEIPSGVRTITGVATSITAFIGRALRGPTDQPITINSFADFERAFGGLWLDSALGFAVRDFYLNGGGPAIIVRLYSPETGGGAKPGKSKITKDALVLEPLNPGTWGNQLRIRVTNDVPAAAAARFGLTAAEMFNLLVRDGSTGVIESYLTVTFKDSPRRIDRVLKSSSALVQYAGAQLAGSESVTPHTDPAAGKTLWDDNNASTGAGVVAVDGLALTKDDFIGAGKQANKLGLYALQNADLFNLLCLPPYKQSSSGLDVEADLVTAAAVYCQQRRAFLLVDPPSDWNTKDKAKSGVGNLGTGSNHAALFFPRLRQANPLRGNQAEDFVPCGAVAGVFARTDATRGVWKAPAGLDAMLIGVPELSVQLSDAENGELNPLGINCLRAMPPAGRVVWGSRTLQGDDRLASEWKYIPVRRTALMIEESLYRGTQWVVFEPNDEPLWAQIRLNLGAFMQNLFRQGAFQGRTPREAYFVKCDKETTTQNDINLGIVNIVVGFAPLKPAEFVVIKIQQMAGQLAA